MRRFRGHKSAGVAGDARSAELLNSNFAELRNSPSAAAFPPHYLAPTPWHYYTPFHLQLQRTGCGLKVDGLGLELLGLDKAGRKEVFCLSVRKKRALRIQPQTVNIWVYDYYSRKSISEQRCMLFKTI